MKRVKLYLCGMLLVSIMVYMTACSSNDNNTESTAPPATSMETSSGKSGTMESTSISGTTKNGESSTGVINGLIDDVESGVDDMTGNGTRSSDEKESTTVAR